MFGVALGCLESIQIFSLYSVICIRYFALRCFHSFQDVFFYVVFGSFANDFCVFFLEVVGFFYFVVV